MAHKLGMLQQGIHQTDAPQLIDQGHVTFRRFQRPGESPGITGPDTIQFPADPGPELDVVSIQTLQKSGLG